MNNSGKFKKISSTSFYCIIPPWVISLIFSNKCVTVNMKFSVCNFCHDFYHWSFPKFSSNVTYRNTEAFSSIFFTEAWQELYENVYTFVFRYIRIIVLNNAITMCCDDEMSYNVNKVSPDGYVQTKQHGRKNGWTRPWHPLQIVGWFFLIFFGVTHFSIIVLYLPLEWKAAGIIVSFLILLACAQ